MEILDMLPNDITFNVIKYLRHPLAEILKPSIDSFERCEKECDFYSFMLKDDGNYLSSCTRCGRLVPDFLLDPCSGYMCEFCCIEEDDYWESYNDR